MIITEKHPALGGLIRAHPGMFSITEIIGTFDGSELICNFIKNNRYLEKITCYENFSFTDDTIIIDKFKKLYKSWEEYAPNIKVQLADGADFNKNSNYVHIENNKPDGQPTVSMEEFVVQNSHKLQDKWFSISGFNTNMKSTYNVFKLIDSHNYYPVMIIADFIFLTSSYDVYKEYVACIQQFADINSVKIRIEMYDGNHKTIKLLQNDSTTWEDRILRATQHD